jgi:AAA family ATP:ADP antiporter
MGFPFPSDLITRKDSMSSDYKDSKNGLERFLSMVTEVRPGEGKTILLMTAGIFLILMAFIIVKVVRTTLIIADVGAEMKNYTAAVQAIVLVVILNIYSRLAVRFPRRQLIKIMFLSVIGLMILLPILYYAHYGGKLIFYFAGGLPALVMIALFWAYANDVCTPEQGKRLFVLLGFGASAGAVVGPIAARVLLEHMNLLSIGFVVNSILLFSLIFAVKVDKHVSVGSGAITSKDSAIKPLSVKGIEAFKVVFQSKYLLAIAAIVLLTNLVNSTGEYILNKSLEDIAVQKAAIMGAVFDPKIFIGKFYSTFYLILGVTSLLMQVLVVSRILKYLGVIVAIMVSPAIAFGGYFLISIVTVSAVIGWMKLIENATDTSLNSTTKHILFLPTTWKEKYIGKIVIDSFVFKAGDILAAVLIFAGVTYFSMNVRQFAVLNICFAAIWLVLSYQVGKANRSLVAKAALNKSIEEN